ncbi:hypothetical protein JCM6882_006391 [Rhodosporidiobolus microsporus]
MAGPPPPPQAFVVGSEWPLSHAEQYAELAFQRVAHEGGFPVCSWTERGQGRITTGFQCAIGHEGGACDDDEPWCPFMVKVAAPTGRLKGAPTTTFFVHLAHDHGQYPPESVELKTHKKEARAVMKDTEAELERLVEERWRELHEGDDFRAGSVSTVQETMGVLSRARQQEMLVWDLAVALGREKAEAFETRMMEKAARDYPDEGALHRPEPFFLPQPLSSTPAVLLALPASTFFGRPPGSRSSLTTNKRSSKAKAKNARPKTELKAVKKKRRKTPDFPSYFNLPTNNVSEPTGAAPTPEASYDDDFESEGSTDDVLVLRCVDQLPPHTSTKPPSRPVKRSKAAVQPIPSTASDDETSAPLAGPSRAQAQPSTNRRGIFTPQPAANEGIALRDIEITPRGRPTVGQQGMKGLVAPPFFPSPSTSSSGSGSSSPSPLGLNPAFSFPFGAAAGNLDGGAPSYGSYPRLDSTNTSPSVSIAAVPPALEAFLRSLAASHAPPFEEDFVALGPLLVELQLTTVEKLLFTAEDDLEALEEDLMRPGLQIVLRSFRKAVGKWLAEAKGKGEM